MQYEIKRLDKRVGDRGERMGGRESGNLASECMIQLLSIMIRERFRDFDRARFTKQNRVFVIARAKDVQTLATQ